MKRFAHLLALAFLPALLASCLSLNSVTPLSASLVPNEKDTLVVFGVSVEGAWSYPKLGLAFDEYDFSKQKITGNCWRFNRMLVSADPATANVQYFAFAVPAGHYIFSGFNAQPLSAAENTFVIPEGQFVYLGDFVYTKAQKIELHQNLDAAQKQVRLLWPNFNKTLLPAKAIAAPQGGLFLRTP